MVVASRNSKVVDDALTVSGNRHNRQRRLRWQSQPSFTDTTRPIEIGSLR